MIKPVLVRTMLVGAALALTLGVAAPSFATAPASPIRLISSSMAFMADPLGPITDVTTQWKSYQPANDFCIKPDVAEFPASTDATQIGSNPACSFSGFGAQATGLYEVHITAPPLCPGCHRLFIDYSKMAPDSGLALHAHGHAYFRPMSANPTYQVGPTAHSPNVKNLTNDALVAPPGTALPAITSVIDSHLMAYVGDTAGFGHIAVQGPYYVGPWYVNTAGQRIKGAYLDVDLSQAIALGSGLLDGIGYVAGFDANPADCPDTLLLGSAYADGNYFYGGCVNYFGSSTWPGVDPWTAP